MRAITAFKDLQCFFRILRLNICHFLERQFGRTSSSKAALMQPTSIEKSRTLEQLTYGLRAYAKKQKE